MLGLSQSDVAARIGRSRQYVWMQENHPNPDPMMVLAIQRIADEIRAKAA